MDADGACLFLFSRRHGKSVSWSASEMRRGFERAFCATVEVLLDPRTLRALLFFFFLCVKLVLLLTVAVAVAVVAFS